MIMHLLYQLNVLSSIFFLFFEIVYLYTVYCFSYISSPFDFILAVSQGIGFETVRTNAERASRYIVFASHLTNNTT